MPLDPNNLGFLITDVQRLLRREFNRRIEATGLTLAQARCLALIARNEGLRQVELAELLEIRPISMVGLLDQLAGAGLVERQPDPSDRRAYRLYLAPGAEQPLETIRAVADEIRDFSVQDLSQKDRLLLLASLRKMRDRLASRTGDQ
ncbi:MAG TPA: MarR family transcriptional regulator [Spongiibacteraceae bacterium]|jgi:DNA-binding MarR family transcriptional regulator|nr:MarR family transcriptional regulator [Spongiibacteraceae bacterium]HUH38359.1 MarR family transcriptional regulator [Spongiibacteraceae bacterium]